MEGEISRNPNKFRPGKTSDTEGEAVVLYKLSNKKSRYISPDEEKYTDLLHLLCPLSYAFKGREVLY